MTVAAKRLRVLIPDGRTSVLDQLRSTASQFDVELGGWVVDSRQRWSAPVLGTYGRGKVEFWRAVRERGWDLAISDGLSPGSPGVIALDADSTLVLGEGIDELAARAGVESEVAAITDRAMAGELDYAESLLERVARLRGLRSADLEAVAKGIVLRPGALECVQQFRELGWRVLVVSGGFDFYLDEIARRLPIDGVVGNRLSMRNNTVTGEIEGTVVGAEEKASAVEEWLQKESRVQSIAVGDGANDRAMMERASIAIGVSPRSALFSVIDGMVCSGDLSGVGELCGLRRG
jgi:phosphoserine phosphatase